MIYISLLRPLIVYNVIFMYGLWDYNTKIGMQERKLNMSAIKDKRKGANGILDYVIIQIKVLGKQKGVALQKDQP